MFNATWFHFTMRGINGKWYERSYPLANWDAAYALADQFVGTYKDGPARGQTINYTTSNPRPTITGVHIVECIVTKPCGNTEITLY